MSQTPMPDQTYTVSVSGRTYWNIVLPALEQLDLPTPLVVRAGRGAQARFEGLSRAQAAALALHCHETGRAWLNGSTDAGSSILARVFLKDGQSVLDQMEGR